MSRLKELRLHGFKSFAEPTRFVFAPGVNAVIGPNGSGKSNMADAVRWVLGEQSNRSLRTRRSDDVIFAGSEGRRPQGMAEAILTLDNADGWLPIDFAEVTIGRRAYRSGESEYLINDARARLRDVVELLAAGRLGANELVVVGQGTVDAALSLRPDERRQLFEEAAGVKNLQVRKNEAGARLTRARDSLARVADLMGELKPQVRRLALQATHQQEHETLGRRARELVEESHRRRERSARSALGEARRAAAAAEAALEDYRAEQAAGRDAITAAESQYWEAESAARRAGEAREATREVVIRSESRAESLAARRGDLLAAVERDQRELDAANAELAASSQAPADDVAPLIAAAVAAEERWRAAVEALSVADSDLIAAEEELAELRRRESGRIADAARRAEEEAGATARRERAERERSDAAQALTAARRRLLAAEDEQRVQAASLAVAQAELDAAAEARDQAQAQADETRQRSSELSQHLPVLRAERQVLENRAEGGRLATLLAKAGWTELLEALDAPDDAWPAIEAVVGGELEQALLWRDAELETALVDARGAARLLATGGGAPEGRDTALAAVGASRTLAEWVGTERAPTLFERTAVAPDLHALVAGWPRLPAGWSAVTPFGDLADARGLLSVRGRAEAPVSLAAHQRARRRELDTAIARADADLAEAGAAAHAAAERLRAVRDAHLASRAAHDAADEAARRAHAAAAESSALVERAERDLARANEALAATDDAPAPAEDAATLPMLDELERRAAAARQRRDRAAVARDEARDAWSAARAAAEEAETRAAGLSSPRSLLEARIAALSRDLPRKRRELDEATAAEAEAQAASTAAHAADTAAAQERTAREEDREARRTELLELERGTAGAVARLSELEREAQATAVEASRREDALAALARERELALEGLPEPGSTPGGGQTAGADPELPAMDDEAIENELRRVRRTLSQIGSVNPFAVEEHRELSTRLDEFDRQRADLEGAIASTEALIARLESEIGAQFDAAFRAIGERFDEYCRLLFAGGSASLQMASDADPADGEAPGGIEIVVRPPGKRLQRLAMLSGGERALTGVALLFAMLSVNPVPFCILDEVDAALDEANIGRFADALRRLAESIDFVVITHNRATIEVADTIYGVTMTDAAVSRVLSLRLADLPAEATA